jgi:hypothetical protein
MKYVKCHQKEQTGRPEGVIKMQFAVFLAPRQQISGARRALRPRSDDCRRSEEGPRAREKCTGGRRRIV